MNEADGLCFSGVFCNEDFLGVSLGDEGGDVAARVESESEPEEM